MNRTVLANVLLLLALAFSCGVDLFFHFDPEKRNPYLINNMVDSPAYADQSANPGFANGQTLQMPEPGTQARGFEPLEFHGLADKEMDRAGRELANPLAPGNRADLARGREIWQRMCVACHGTLARGDGPVAKKGFPAPPSLLTKRVREFRDGAIFYRLTFGGKLMPSYAAQVERADRWKCVLYIRELEKQYPAPEKGKP